jgi:hypothetical protein
MVCEYSVARGVWCVSTVSRVGYELHYSLQCTVPST